MQSLLKQEMSKLFVLLFVLGLTISSQAQTNVVDRIIAVVNNEIITETDLTQFQKNADKQGYVDDFLLMNTAISELKNSRKLTLDYLVNERILDGEIKRLNLTVTFERVDQEIRDIAKRNGVSRQELLSAIQNQGLKVSEYQSFLKTRIERQSLIEAEISSKIRVADEDVEAEYVRQNPQLKVGVAEYTLAQIYFNPRKGGLNSALDRARAVLGKINSGLSFEEAAEQNSEDPNFTNGGYLGVFKAGEFSKEIEDSIQNLKVGGVSEVTVTKAGVSIFHLLARKTVKDPQYQKEAERLRSFLFERAFQKHFKTWLEMKREEAFVTIKQ